MWGLVAVWLSTIGASSGDFAGHDRPGDGPDLRGEAIWPVEGELAWLRALEAPAVLAELQEVVLADAAVAVAANASVFTPKFSASWDLATAAQDWQALPLQNKGRADAAGCAIAPITCGVLAKLHPHLVPRGPAASEVGVRLLKLAGGASLRRHVGPGGRLVAHLGVSVPPSASLTVNGQELHWGEGKLLVFDDAFEHSAQNLAADQPRYILQVTIPHPRGQAGVTIDTDLFALTIDTETCTVTTTLKFPSPVKSSAPVPFVSLYNRISDSQPSDWDACVTASSKGPGLLEVTAAHGYGHIRLSYTAHPHFVIFTLNATDGWHGDPVERHISFGQFWTGIVPDCVPTDGNCTAPTVMGRLQGPRWFGGTGEVALPSAGFVSITNHSYYKYVFYAVAGDAVGVTIAPSAEVGHVVKEIAKASGTFFDNPNRFKSWLWTQGITGSASLVPGSRRTGVFNHSYWVDRSLALGVQLLFISNAIQVEDWEINTHEYPNITENAAFVRSHGLGFGIHTLPYPPGNAPPENLVQDGLAPTYRSGRWSSPTAAVGLEDMGFWWGHDNQGSLAVNGNPNGPCPQLVPGYDCSRWGSNMSLFNATWSTAGKFRAGGAIAFDGKSSFGVAKHVSIWDGWGADITLGLTIHPASDHGVIVSRAGSFELAMDAGRLVWSVTTAGGGAVNVSSATTLKAGECYTLKLTYNSSSAEAKILIENRLDAVARHPLALTGQPLGLAASTSDIIFGATAATVAGGLTAAADGSPVKWAGAMEEVYLKNVSTEHRRVYIYTDNVRPTSAGNVRVFDLSTAHGRTYYAGVMSNILNAADFDTTQWDGFEILLLMPLYNFNHSAKTFGDKMYRGIPSPDWYNLGWPLAVGQDWLAAMEETHRMTNSHTAVECSFMAPGSGPWRPDMAPYVDEHLPDVVKLGLEWHPKMLFRTLLSGLIINPYHTPLSAITNEYNVSYWLGGLIATGVAPQIDDRPDGHWDTVVKGWMDDYKFYGHMQEDGAYMLHYDESCCHIQGEACEWVACNDVMVSVLAGGSGGNSTIGLYAASSTPTSIPPSLTTNGSRILVFQAFGTEEIAISVGSPIDETLTLAMLTDVELTLSGGFLQLHSQQQLQVLTYNASVGDRRNLKLVGARIAFAKGTSGAQTLKISGGIYQTVVLQKSLA